MEAADIKSLKELEEENRKPKRKFVNLSLEREVLKDIIAKSSEASREAEDRRLRSR